LVFSQTLAPLACITTKTLSDIENNLIDPRFSTIKGLCKILGIVINFKTFEE
jgi:DNA-binding XRE family transcriptional regulator